MLQSLGCLEKIKLCGNPLGGQAGMAAIELKEAGNAAFGERKFKAACAAYGHALDITGDPGLRCTLLSNRAEARLQLDLALDLAVCPRKATADARLFVRRRSQVSLTRDIFRRCNTHL